MKILISILFFLSCSLSFAQLSNTRIQYSLAADVTSSTVANTLTDVTGLSFTVRAGNTYRFHAQIIYTSAATTTGSRWTINTPATSLLSYTSQYTLTATTMTVNYATAANTPAASSASSLLTNICIIDGVFTPSASGNFTIRFASEVANSAIICKSGSTLEIW